MSERAQLILPWDVLLHLLQVADRRALALLSQVSFDFLQAAGPLLYDCVEIRSRLQMERLLCSTPNEDEDSSPSRITSFLSLSQTHHLTLDYTFHSSTSFDHLAPSFLHLLSTSRLNTPTIQANPLQLQCLHIILSFATAQITQHLIRTELLHRFNPSLFEVTLVQPFPPAQQRPASWRLIGDPHDISHAFDRWDRLERVVLDGALPFAIRRDAEVVLDLSRTDEHAAQSHMGPGTIAAPLSRASFARRLVMMNMVGRAGRLRLLVGSEDERERVAREIEELEEGVREKLDVEVIGSGSRNLSEVDDGGCS